MKVRVHLTDAERELLSRPVNGEGGFQSLLRKLQVAMTEGDIVADEALVERIVRSAGNCGSGGFQGRLRSLAQRLAAAMARAKAS